MFCLKVNKNVCFGTWNDPFDIGIFHSIAINMSSVYPSMIFLCILLISGQNIATSQQVHGKWWLGLVTSSQNLLLFPVWVLLFVCPK
jgi:hypothetical protein